MYLTIGPDRLIAVDCQRHFWDVRVVDSVASMPTLPTPATQAALIFLNTLPQHLSRRVELRASGIGSVLSQLSISGSRVLAAAAALLRATTAPQCWHSYAIASLGPSSIVCAR